MKNQIMSVVLCATLAACSSSNPFDDNAAGEEDETPTDTGNPINSDRTLPPGTASPTPAVGIFRSEPTSTDDATNGNGFATDVAYNSEDDTFTVDNLAFDGDNVYQRGTNVSSLGDYAVYEASQTFPDTLTERPILQLNHRAIYGVSQSGSTEFAIIRTGDYVQYGFGGFVYQRNDNVQFPEGGGQALYTGQTAGVRDFNGRGGLEYTTADISIAIDFEDFNDANTTRGDGVQGFVHNRMVYDINGNDITEDVIARINETSNASLEALPNATFVIGPNVLDNNGELVGQVSSRFGDNTGSVRDYENGTYYGILSGDSAEELVGVLVLENQAEQDGVTVRETSGFIIYR